MERENKDYTLEKLAGGHHYFYHIFKIHTFCVLFTGLQGTGLL